MNTIIKLNQELSRKSEQRQPHNFLRGSSKLRKPHSKSLLSFEKPTCDSFEISDKIWTFADLKKELNG